MRLRLLFTCLCVVLCGLPASAQITRFSAAGAARLDLGAFRKTPKPEEEAIAMAELKRNLLAKAISAQPSAVRDGLDPLFNSLNADDYLVPGTLFITDRNVNKESKVLTLVGQADVKVDSLTRLAGVNGANAAMGGPAGGPKAGAPLISWLFAARRIDTLSEFDPEVFTRSTKQDTTESEVAVAAGSTSKTDGQQKTVSTSGGQRRKADKMEFTLDEPHRATLNAAINSQLIQHGLTPVGLLQLQRATKGDPNGEFVISKVLEDFKQASDLSDDNKITLLAAAQKAKIQYFATGCATVNMKSIFPATGEWRVGVQVIANVYKFQKDPDTGEYVDLIAVGSAPPKIVPGIASKVEDAENAAMGEAAKVAADIISAQLARTLGGR